MHQNATLKPPIERFKPYLLIWRSEDKVWESVSSFTCGFWGAPVVSQQQASLAGKPSLSAFSKLLKIHLIPVLYFSIFLQIIFCD